MNGKDFDDECSFALKRYEEALGYINESNMYLFNPKKAFAIFEQLANEGYVVADFYCGIMILTGLGKEKNVDKGKEILRSHEKCLGYKTEVLLEQWGLFKELSQREQIECIHHWETNNQLTHALYLKTQRNHE